MNDNKSASRRTTRRNLFSAGLFLVVFLLLKLFFPHIGKGDAEGESQASFWAQEDSWYCDTLSAVREPVDVFYLISTEVISAKDSLGQLLYRSALAPEDRRSMEEEMRYVRDSIFFSDYRFFSPYYHQLTFDAIMARGDTLQTFYKAVSEEVCDAFDYYMEHWNGGRPFVLAGFSQGAMLLLDVLRHMTDEQFSRMAAAYEIGYRLTEEDLQHPHIRAAQGEEDSQVVVSYNSVLSREGIWPLVSRGAATGINPVNWKTDSTPAAFSYRGMEGEVRLDSTTFALLVDIAPESFHQWLDNPVCRWVGMSQDCLHHWDLLFYTRFIHENAKKRAGNLKN